MHGPKDGKSSLALGGWVTVPWQLRTARWPALWSPILESEAQAEASLAIRIDQGLQAAVSTVISLTDPEDGGILSSKGYRCP